jgi:hypothetical protein
VILSSDTKALHDAARVLMFRNGVTGPERNTLEEVLYQVVAAQLLINREACKHPGLYFVWGMPTCVACGCRLDLSSGTRRAYIPPR